MKSRRFKNEAERVAYREALATWLSPDGMVVLIPKARWRPYDKLLELQRRRIEVSCTIARVLEREGVGAGLPWHEQWRAIEKVQDERVEAWENAWLSDDAPIPQTPLEELMDEHHRLWWAEHDQCDDIEKDTGAVCPLFDTRPYAAACPRPY